MKSTHPRRFNSLFFFRRDIRRDILLLMFVLCFHCPAVWAQQPARNVTDSRGQKQGRWVKTSSDGTLVYEGSFSNNQPVGQWKRYHPDGKLKAELDFGTQGGDTCRATLYSEEGVLLAKGLYCRQKKEGLWLNYNEIGQLTRKQQYRQGLSEGIGETLGEGGRLLEQTDWKNGRLNGLSKEYDLDGQLINQTSYKDDQLEGPVTYYHPSGQVRLQGTYVAGKRTGTWQSFSKTGVLTGTTVYHNGVADDNDAQVEKESRQLELMSKQKGRFDEPEASF